MTIPKPEPFVKPDMIFSVSDAAALLKGVIETAFPVIKIRGELSQITRATSGHIYMTIKDAGAAISVIIWRGTPVNFQLADGLEVIITGRFTTYPARSNYQIIAAEIEMAGAGAILKMLEERKKKLAAEGLFDAARKKPLPRFPSVIGVVTSPTGAAFQDIINRLKERFPVTVLLYPAQVQGVSAATEVAAGIKFFNDLPKFDTSVTAGLPLPLRQGSPVLSCAAGDGFNESNKQNDLSDTLINPPPGPQNREPPPAARAGVRPDVIIVARGGGSLEDLLPFSEEVVVRAVAASEIPVVSGVGHEPDWMLIDFAADFRAPTPTGAAEAVVPTKISVLTETENLSHRLSSAYVSRLKNLRAAVVGLSVKSPKQMIMERAQRLDDLGRTMNIIFQNKITAARTTMMHADRLPVLLINRLAAARQIVTHAGQMLSSLSYKNVLARGYAIVRHNTKIISRAADFAQPAEIEFADGIVKV
ncbi:MAG: exodeoxyribonuclease VII large subunit [Proteobacteria bacterium]|nr:exodeoxyribonuclease VII large subunit [Pseudomonadota bacterium]